MPFILGANSAADTVHSISQSIRFNALDNPYMSKAFSSKGSPKKFTLSWWTKLSNRTIRATSESQMFFIAYHSSGYQTDFSIQSSARASGVSHTFRTYSTTTSGSAVWNFATTQVFRDPSAWYNFVVVSDTDHAVETERFKLYVNGQRVTDFGSATYPGSGVEPVWNNSTNVTHYIGSRAGNVNTRFDGYMAEMVHIDGQALDPSSFGETNSSGLWVPIDVSGLTFGTNGFHIDGRDANDLGDDEAGSNDFTTSGMEANDQVSDSPTNNKVTFNPLNNQRSGGTPKNGDLEYHGPGTRTLISLTAAIPSTGKWVVAMTANSMSTAVWNFGVNLITNTNYGDAAGSNEDLGRPLGLHQYPYSGWFTNYFENSSSGTQISPSPSVTPTTSDEFWAAIDMATGKVFMGIYDADDSGSGIKWLAQDGGLDGNPTTGDNPTYTFSDFINNKDVTFGFASKNSSTTVTLLREADCTGTTPTDYTYFENVKDLIGS